MEVPATAPAAAPAPKQQPSLFQLAWPRSAQTAFAFLLGAILTLLAIHAYGYTRWGTRPTELERGVGITYRVDLNHATRAELLQLPGIGESLARRIEDYRLEHGRFQHVNDLIEVHGIGPATLERLRPWVQVKWQDGERLDQEADEQRPVLRLRGRETPRRSDSSSSGSNAKEASLSSPIDVNRASLTDLQRLPGVGPKMSQKIVDEREKSPFKSIDDLRRVHGIGPKTLERLRPHVIVNAESTRIVSADRDGDSSEQH
jgi:competence protein ComEA